MVVDSILRGMLGIETDAAAQRITLSPHLPANWKAFDIRNITAGNCVLDVSYMRSTDVITLTVQRKDIPATVSCSLEFNPAISLRAEASSVEFEGRALHFRVVLQSGDQHLDIGAALHPGSNVLRIHLYGDFTVSYDSGLPILGSPSRELHILSEASSASRDRLTLNLSGIAGRQYFLDVSDAAQIASIDGGDLLKNASGADQMRVRIPDGAPNTFVNSVVTIHFREKHRERKASRP